MPATSRPYPTYTRSPIRIGGLFFLYVFVSVRASDGVSVYHGDAGNLCGGVLQALGLTLPAVREHAMIDRKAPLLVSTGTFTDAHPITRSERWTFAFAHREWSYDCTVTVA